MAKTIFQEIEFENNPSSVLYDMFLSSKHHSNIRGGMPADIQPVEGSIWNINNGHLYGKILKLVKDKLIVLSWRSGVTSTPEDLDMIVILHFIQTNKNSRIELIHSLIPDERRYDIYFKNWNERYWTPWKNYINSFRLE